MRYNKKMFTFIKRWIYISSCVLLLGSQPVIAFLGPLRSRAVVFDHKNNVPVTPQIRRLAMPTVVSMSSTLDEGAIISTDTSENDAAPTAKPRAHYDSVVCGGGPAGLLTAIMLARKYGPSHRIAVFERRSTAPPSPADETVWSDAARFYLLGIGHRGQKALREFGVFDDFEKASVEVGGRRDWQPGMTRVEDGKITPAKKTVPSRVLARDKLVGVLYEHIVKNYIEKLGSNIDLLYGYEVEPTSFGGEIDNGDDYVSLRASTCEEALSKEAAEDVNSSGSSKYVASQESEEVCSVDDGEYAITTNLLVGADGSARTVANAMEREDDERKKKLNPLRRLLAPKSFRVKRYIDDNRRVFKSVPVQLPPDWPRGLNYSARSRGSRITLEALPSDGEGMLCALLLMKPEDELAEENCDPAKLRGFFDEEFPQFSALIDDNEISRVASKPCSALPAFRYAGPRLNMGRHTIVLGDAAHTVKPYYGLGANTALEDVCVLSRALDDAAAAAENKKTGGDFVVPEAVKLFSDRRAGDSAALVQISRNMDRSGKLFFFSFVLPLILDGIFHKAAPRIFGPNMFGMFQKQGIGFKQIQRKKRIDRALQCATIGSVLALSGLGATTAVKVFARAIHKTPAFVLTRMAVLASAGMIWKKASRRSEKPKETTQ